MKFNPYSWSDSSSPKGSKSITKTQVCLHRTIPIIVSPLFLPKYTRGKRNYSPGYRYSFFWGGGGRGEEWHWVILRSWNHPDFSMNPKLFTGSRERVLGKPFLGRGGGRQIVCSYCCQKRFNFYLTWMCIDLPECVKHQMFLPLVMLWYLLWYGNSQTANFACKQWYCNFVCYSF